MVTGGRVGAFVVDVEVDVEVEVGVEVEVEVEIVVIGYLQLPSWTAADES